MTILQYTTTHGRSSRDDRCPECNTIWRDHPLGDCRPGIAIGTCQGCGGYGRPGSICIRNGYECGEFI